MLHNIRVSLQKWMFWDRRVDGNLGRWTDIGQTFSETETIIVS